LNEEYSGRGKKLKSNAFRQKERVSKRMLLPPK